MSDKKLRVLELYSGIGGMHWALKESGVPYEIVLAVDINTTANQIYKHNFPEVDIHSFGIEKLSLKKLRSLCPNAIMMSPPCQPFSRVGKKGDCDDVRTKSFLHVLQLLIQMDTKPDYILVENVKGFETSRTRQHLIDTLNVCGYVYQEYLLTPLQFGIPNSRLRYYMVATLNSSHPVLSQSTEIHHWLPESLSTPPCNQDQDLLSVLNQGPSSQNIPHANLSTTTSSNYENKSSDIKPNDNESCDKVMDTTEYKDMFPHRTDNVVKSHSCLSSTQNDVWSKQPSDSSCTVKDFYTESKSCSSEIGISSYDGGKNSVGVQNLQELIDAGRNMRFCEDSDVLIKEESRPLSSYMEEGELNDFQHFLVADKDLRQFVVMDIVLSVLKKSTCFTKRYGHYIEGAGSLVQMATSVEDTRAASLFKSKAVEMKNKHEWGEEELSIIRRLKLRYFSPREVANLLCFPKEFEFPESVSNIQKYRCLGNSLNVHVVAKLVTLLTADWR